VSELPRSEADAFTDIVSALTQTIIRAHGGSDSPPAHDRVVRFVAAQCGRAPDYLRLSLRLATLAFDLSAVAYTGHRFRRLDVGRRQRIVATWKRAPLAACRDLMRFYESLVVFGWTSIRDEPRA